MMIVFVLLLARGHVWKPPRKLIAFKPVGHMDWSNVSEIVKESEEATKLRIQVTFELFVKIFNT